MDVIFNAANSSLKGQGVATVPVVTPNNYPVPANPCLYAGNSLPPSAYAQTGAADKNNPTNYILDGLTGFRRAIFSMVRYWHPGLWARIAHTEITLSALSWPGRDDL